MAMELQAVGTLQLLLAALLGALIGLDRERGDRPAGLRTHMLVCLGACLFTLLSRHAFPGNDTGRVAANIVVGIGFLGAGVIVERHKGIKNITTAATIWATAAVGMAVGTGAWFLALSATVLIWIILAVILRFERRKVIDRAAAKDDAAPESSSTVR